MNLLLLFGQFVYIGILAFGGGMAVIPFLQELVNQSPVITQQDLSNVIALSQMTPGAIGVNMATYTGFILGGFTGSFLATFALILPSIIIVSLVSRYWQNKKENPIFNSIFNGAKASVAGLLVSTFFFLICALFQTEKSMTDNFKIGGLFLMLALIVFKYKPSPMLYILGMGFIGILFQL